MNELAVVRVTGRKHSSTYHTSKLLQRLKQATSQKTPSEISAEAVEVSGLAQAHLVLVVGGNLTKLLDKCRVVDIKPAEGGQRLGGALRLATLNPHARRLRKEDHAEEDDQSPGELHGDGDAVAASIITVLGGVVYDGSEEKAL